MQTEKPGSTRNPQATPGVIYRNASFLEGDEGRPIRILSEYLGPLATLRNLKVHDTIVFFGSARQGSEGPFARYYEDARRLAGLVTRWSKSISAVDERFIVCTGGGGGMMEAANRGATEAGGRTIGLNIGLPTEQRPNPFITPGLGFEFHYFFMRKLWFAHLARAMVFFPGGFGTLDELFEVLTLAQTQKLGRRSYILLYGTSYWRELINFDALIRNGMIASSDTGLFGFADEPATALAMLQAALPVEAEPAAPAFASSIDSCCCPGPGR